MNLVSFFSFLNSTNETVKESDPDPEDILAMQKWLFFESCKNVREASEDSSLTAQDRRAEKDRYLKTASALMPNFELFKAREALRQSESEEKILETGGELGEASGTRHLRAQA